LHRTLLPEGRWPSEIDSERPRFAERPVTAKSQQRQLVWLMTVISRKPGTRIETNRDHRESRATAPAAFRMTSPPAFFPL
jgi:hypothetical protein